MGSRLICTVQILHSISSEYMWNLGRDLSDVWKVAECESTLCCHCLDCYVASVDKSLPIFFVTVVVAVGAATDH